MLRTADEASNSDHRAPAVQKYNSAVDHSCRPSRESADLKSAAAEVEQAVEYKLICDWVGSLEQRQ